MRAVGPAEPVGADPVVQPEGVQPDLEGAHVQAAVGATEVLEKKTSVSRHASDR